MAQTSLNARNFTYKFRDYIPATDKQEKRKERRREVYKFKLVITKIANKIFHRLSFVGQSWHRV